MSQYSYLSVAFAACLLAACSSSNTTENEIQNDQMSPMTPAASTIENGQQFSTTGRAAILATQLSTGITNTLNTLNEAVTSGMTNGMTSGIALADNCLASFEEGLGKPVADFSCNSNVTLNGKTVTEFSGQVLLTDYCEASLATQQAQNCALQNGTIGLPLEWIADETGTPSPLVATTITYRNADMVLTITTSEQVGLAASNCTYDMANNGQTDDETAAECFARLVEGIDRLQSSFVEMTIHYKE